MALHFSAERPDDQFYTDFGNLNKFEEEVSLCWLPHYPFSPISLFPQPFSKLSSILFSFLVSPEQVS